MSKKRNPDGSLTPEEEANFRARCEIAHARYNLRHGLPLKFEVVESLNAIPGLTVHCATIKADDDEST